MRFNRFGKKKLSRKNSDPFIIKTGEHESVEGISYRQMWTEESFISRGGGKDTIGRNFNISRLPFVYAVMLFFLLIIVGRTAWLQGVKGEYYYSMAEGNRIRLERVEAKRGIIYDRDHKPFVRNAPNFLLYFVPSDLPEGEELERIIKRIAEILGDKTEEEIKAVLAEVEPGTLESYQPLFIADNVEYEKAMLLYLESELWRGVVVSNKTRREYDLCRQGESCAFSLSHVIGYTGKINDKELEKFSEEYLPIDYIGKLGIEYFWESDLKGVNGKKHIEVDALGKEKKILGQTSPEDGHNLVLSINRGLQAKMEEVLGNTLQKLKLTGTAIAMDPRNGEILGLVSLPAFDNNKFARGISRQDYEELENNPANPLFNRAISGNYPSGSTIKPVIAAAALEEGIINENTSFVSTGGIRIGQWFFPDWLAGGHGVTNVRRAIAESINTFFYYIGGGNGEFKGLGVEKIGQYAKLFGLGTQTGVDLAGEASGFIPTEEWKEETKGEQWYIGDTYHLAIGQGDILVTPLQVAMYTSVFANGGVLYRPHLVKEILSSSDQLIKEVDNDPVRQNFISSYNINVVRQGMRQTVTSGSARSLQAVPVEVAGKTGTAQWSTAGDPHAWFTGFAPYENPEIVITVLVEEGVEGSSVAVPVAREILQWYFSQDSR